MLVLVTANSPSCGGEGGFDAGATMCYWDPAVGRPLVGEITWCKTADKEAPEAQRIESDVEIATHELMHLLVQ